MTDKKNIFFKLDEMRNNEKQPICINKHAIAEFNPVYWYDEDDELYIISIKLLNQQFPKYIVFDTEEKTQNFINELLDNT